jgi:predicted RND superfamily exporter protein
MDTLNSKAFSPGATDAEAGFPCGRCCQSNGWYVCKMKQVREAYGMQTFNAWRAMSKYYTSGDNLQWAFVTINSTMPIAALPLKETEEHYDDWSGFVAEHLKDVGAYQTTPHWPFMVMQRTLLSSAMTSIALCLAIAWIVLCVATANWIMATLCLFCIVTILIVFAGFMPIYGYDLGIFETVGLIVVLGLSVDYTVHIGHCYNENRLPKGEKERGEERVHRVTHALAEMGISVTSGAATTLLASMFLLPAKFAFYHVMGIFMFTTVVISTFVSLTMLPALLLIFGPTQDAGDVACLSKVSAWFSSRLRSLCSKKETKAGPTESPGAANEN